MFRKLSLASLANLLFQIGAAGLAFFVSPILIHSLGKTEYGFWLLIFSIVGYLELLDLGMSRMAIRFLSSAIGQGDQQRFASLFLGLRSHYHRIALLILIVSGATCLTGYVGVGFSENVTRLLILTGVAGMVTSVSFFFRAYTNLLRAHMHYDYLSWAGLGRLGLHATLIMVFRNYISINRLLALHVGLVIMEQSIVYFMARGFRPTERAQALGRKEWRDMIGHASKNILTSLADKMRFGVDSQILAGAVSLPAVTQYGVGCRFPMLYYDMITAVFGSQLIAAFSQMEENRSASDRSKILRITIQICSAACFSGAIALFLLTPAFIERWLGPGFDEAKQVARILLPAFALSGAQGIVGNYLIAKSCHGRIMVLTLISAVLNLVASLILVKFYGVLGVVYATAGEFCLVFLAMPFLASSVMEWSVGKYWLEIIIRPLFWYVGVAVPCSWFVVRWLAPVSYWEICVAGSLCLLVAAIVSWWGFFDASARGRIREKGQKFFVNR